MPYSRMLFRIEHDLRGVDIDTRSLPQTFRVAGMQDNEVLVTFRPAFEEPQPGNEHIKTAVCEARTAIDPPRAVYEDFLSLEESRLPNGSRLDPERWGGRPFFLDEDDAVKGHYAPFEVLPSQLQDAIRQVTRELRAATTRTVALLRWRLADDGPHQPLNSRRAEWSLAGDAWRPLPQDVRGDPSANLVPPISERVREDVQAYLDQGVEEPLAHALWREAWELRNANPRSALLIGMASLEVGVKQHIAAIVPDATWLLDEPPAPPVHRLLDEYIPMLPTLSGLPPWKLDAAVHKRIRSAQHLRNRVAHAGRGTVDYKGLKQTLETVRSVLITLDVYRGFLWAADPNAQ